MNVSKFDDIDYLALGTNVQRQVYQLLTAHQVMQRLGAYQPMLAGTIPLDINVAGSDLDVICTYQGVELFMADVVQHFSVYEDFKITNTLIDGEQTVLANFNIEGWPVELFGQQVPVKQQAAYRHMVVEYYYLQQHGSAFRQQIIGLKQQGYKTEPAFAKLLNLPGDPYQALLLMYDSLFL